VAVQELGMTVSDVRIPELEQLRIAHTLTIISEMHHNFQLQWHGAYELQGWPGTCILKGVGIFARCFLLGSLSKKACMSTARCKKERA
jgi:hypothetical protein